MLSCNFLTYKTNYSTIIEVKLLACVISLIKVIHFLLHLTLMLLLNMVMVNFIEFASSHFLTLEGMRFVTQHLHSVEFHNY